MTLGRSSPSGNIVECYKDDGRMDDRSINEPGGGGPWLALRCTIMLIVGKLASHIHLLLEAGGVSEWPQRS